MRRCKGEVDDADSPRTNKHIKT